MASRASRLATIVTALAATASASTTPAGAESPPRSSLFSYTQNLFPTDSEADWQSAALFFSKGAPDGTQGEYKERFCGFDYTYAMAQVKYKDGNGKLRTRPQEIITGLKPDPAGNRYLHRTDNSNPAAPRFDFLQVDDGTFIAIHRKSEQEGVGKVHVLQGGKLTVATCTLDAHSFPSDCTPSESDFPANDLASNGIELAKSCVDSVKTFGAGHQAKSMIKDANKNPDEVEKWRNLRDKDKTFSDGLRKSLMGAVIR